MSELKVKSIEAESITLKHPDGKKTITLSAMKNGVGIWLGDSEKQICIFDVDGQFGIGFHNAKNPQVGHEFAIYLDANLGPMIQVVDKDGTVLNTSLIGLLKV